MRKMAKKSFDDSVIALLRMYNMGVPCAKMKNKIHLSTLQNGGLRRFGAFHIKLVAYHAFFHTLDHSPRFHDPDHGPPNWYLIR